MFRALYPSIMGEFNIAPNTQIGRIDIPQTVWEGENAYSAEEGKYSRGGEFVENLVCDNMIEYCHRWFHLANIEEFIDDIDEFMYAKGFGKYSNLIQAGFGNNNGRISPVLPTTTKYHEPVRFNQPKVTSPVIFYNKRNEDITYDKLYKGDE